MGVRERKVRDILMFIGRCLEARGIIQYPESDYIFESILELDKEDEDIVLDKPDWLK